MGKLAEAFLRDCGMYPSTCFFSSSSFLSAGMLRRWLGLEQLLRSWGNLGNAAHVRWKKETRRSQDSKPLCGTKPPNQPWTTYLWSFTWERNNLSLYVSCCCLQPLVITATPDLHWHRKQLYQDPKGSQGPNRLSRLCSVSNLERGKLIIFQKPCSERKRLNSEAGSNGVLSAPLARDHVTLIRPWDTKPPNSAVLPCPLSFSPALPTKV